MNETPNERALRERIEGFINRQAEAFNQVIFGCLKRIEALENKVMALQPLLTQLGTDFTQLTTDLTANQTATQNAIAALNTTIQGLEATGTADAATIASLKEQIANLASATDISDAITTLTNLDNAIKSTDATVVAETAAEAPAAAPVETPPATS